ncbi:FtsB family cell division protein [Aeromicrobium terrae]|uniref:Septum formation initiator family protein n=1 Tax=Aeromicrobium terrae TaxID=2498846 RepID=A0A5C8NFP7_9ACTN|nr:septum formation initiator family protein [Aeromicrobium terrae]TXL57358.1 septum formation initiator family protein [Aeromicrobium terrae]
MAPGSSRGPGRRPSSDRSRRPQRAGRPKPVAPRGRQAPRFTGRAVVLLSVVLLLIASYTSALHAWWEQRGDIQSSRAEIAMRKEAIATLEDTKKRFDDPAYIKQKARERFGWVMPGEVGYRVIGADGSVQGSVPTLDEPPTATKDQAWYDTLWGSVEQAGKDPAKAKPPADPDEVLKKQ